jgi:hypothetical protein
MSKRLYSPKGNELIEVFNTTLFSDCYYCPIEDKIFVEKLTEVPRQHFKDNFYTDRFEEIKQYALMLEAKKKVTKKDLIKLGYL